jgi:catechol 2,3-dioxygenase-like lactoylglutathione lyase family enzyme
MSSERQRLVAIAGFRLVTADLPRLSHFYEAALGFVPDGPERPIGAEAMRLLGIAGSGWRRCLRLGEQRLALDRFDEPGRPMQPGTDAAWLSFQHLALVVTDMAAAYSRLRNAASITRYGPQLLPKSAGGVSAFKFRDPDGHPLELLQFPSGDRKISPGIDHSAISVADASASTVFYESLGLTRGHATLNHGPEQARLDDLQGVEVDVVPMLPDIATPHLELLGYRMPRGQAGPSLRPNDIAATRIVWHGTQPALLRDPDGHLHEIIMSGQEFSA